MIISKGLKWLPKIYILYMEATPCQEYGMLIIFIVSLIIDIILNSVLEINITND